jgi:hypothetical protein
MRSGLCFGAHVAEDLFGRTYEKRNPDSRKELLYLMGGGASSEGSKFAQKQLALIEGGMAEQEAYEKCEEDAAEERERSGLPPKPKGFKTPQEILVSHIQEENVQIQKAMRAELQRAR